MNQQLTFLSAIAVSVGLLAATPPKKTTGDPINRSRSAARSNADPRKFIDPQNMDQSVKPGDNFYQYANGNWLRQNAIPASKTSWGSFNELREKSLDAMKSLLEDASKNTTKGRLYQMVGDYYVSGMDSVT